MAIIINFDLQVFYLCYTHILKLGLNLLGLERCMIYCNKEKEKDIDQVHFAAVMEGQVYFSNHGYILLIGWLIAVGVAEQDQVIKDD